MSRNGRRPSPAITLERAERDLVNAVNELPAVELVLWLRVAAIRDADGRINLSATGRGAVAEHRLETLSPEKRLEVADALRELADDVEPGDRVGVLYFCPACGDRQRIPQAELDDDRIGGRFCEGRVKRHGPVLLAPVPYTDHPRPFSGP